jgi:hypothetical protein
MLKIYATLQRIGGLGDASLESTPISRLTKDHLRHLLPTRRDSRMFRVVGLLFKDVIT